MFHLPNKTCTNITATNYITVLIKFKYCINTRKIFVKGVLQKFEYFHTIVAVVSINYQRNHKSRHRTNKKEIKFYVAHQCTNFITFSKFKGMEQIQASLIYVYIKQRVLRVGEARGSGGRAKRFSLRSGSRGSSIDGATFVAKIVDANNVFTNNRETKRNLTRS